MSKIVKVTLDTNVLGNAEMTKIEEAARGLLVDFASTTVTDRELRGSDIQPPAKLVPEIMVLGESQLGTAVLGSDEDQGLLESLLHIISDGKFPKPGARGCLSKGHRHQLRDAMIVLAHSREERDILVTEDKKGFIKDSHRSEIETLCSTRIMTLDEFCEFCHSLRIDTW
ncbi:MAG: hypothetical protein Q7R39_04180 [Dehalococcoidia bacterium]|nr:hypothetical protein [Dehalococcoidia bacterium]